MTPAVPEMSSENQSPETPCGTPVNGVPVQNPITPIECGMFQATLRVQTQEFASLKDSIDQLSQEMKLFRESFVSILSKWGDSILERTPSKEPT